MALLEGTIAIAVAFGPHHQLLLGARRGSRLVVGDGDGGMLVGTAAAGIAAAGANFEACFTLPEVPDFTAPLLCGIPVRMLAHRAAIRGGEDTDRPRNQAKSRSAEQQQLGNSPLGQVAVW